MLSLARRETATGIDFGFCTSTIKIVLDRQGSWCNSIKHDLRLRWYIDSTTARLPISHETFGTLTGVDLCGWRRKRRILLFFFAIDTVGRFGTDTSCGGCTGVGAVGAGIDRTMKTFPTFFSFSTMCRCGATSLSWMRHRTGRLGKWWKRSFPWASIVGILACRQPGTNAIVRSIGINANGGRRTRVRHRMVFRKQTFVGV